ncbi:MAG TPA: nucleoside-diphosphate sugar epimerase/dehydratase [Flavobacteriaceae bacterium]|nr:nucleoside-diphosphate sugar epimerase/dehydratase [Flavobacteriaceae bacterium]
MKSITKPLPAFLDIARGLIKNYVPRGVIFAIDLTLAFVALQIAFFLVSSIQPNGLDFFNISWQLFAILGVQAFFFFVFKSYIGLIRYSGFKDAIKQLQVTLFCVLAILAINAVYFVNSGEKLILDAGAVIYGFVLFSLLFFFRVVVKRAYQMMHSSPENTRAFILGTDQIDVAIAEGLISESSNKFNIVGFLNENDHKMRNRIFNLPILNFEQFKKSVQPEVAIIVGENKLDKLNAANNEILSKLLELKVKVYKLPRVKDWDDPIPSHALKKINLEDLLQRNPIKLDLNKLEPYYRNKVILVTGAAGSIGSEIVKQLVPLRPKMILLLDQAETPLHDMSLCMCKDYPEQAFKQIIANVRNKKRLRQIFEKYSPEVIFHGAAYKHVPMMEENPIEALDVNFYGTRNLADLAVDYNAERFVFVSTDKAVNPTNIMGASKRAAEIYIQSLAVDAKTRFITTRFGNVLGSNGSVIPHFKKQIEANGPITVTHAEITRYFMTIDEACQLVLEAGGMGNGGEIYVFDMGSPIKIVDLAHHMIRLSGLVPEKDIKIEFTGLRPGEKLYEELLADRETTIPTHHEKIMIAQATHTFDDSKHFLLDGLLKNTKSKETRKAVEILKLLVPEFVSLYEKPSLKVVARKPTNGTHTRLVRKRA